MTRREIDARMRRLPPLRRARFWRLYAEDGRRFLDLAQDGGRGILGARSKGLGSAIKAALDRGLDRPLPSRLEARLVKAAMALWPKARAARLYLGEKDALASIAGITGSALPTGAGLLDVDFILDPARTGYANEEPPPSLAFILRPFAKWLPSPKGGEIALPLLPLARGLGPTVVLFADPSMAEKAAPSDLIPPLLLASALDGLSALADYEAKAREEDWLRMDRRSSALFERRGPWLYPRGSGAEYDRIFDAALAKGLLISPDPDLPSIVPGDFDDGEIAPLASLANTIDSP